MSRALDRSGSVLVALAAVVVLLSAGSAPAAVIVPNVLASVDGDDGNCSPLSGCTDTDRYQQVYSASQFSGPLTISAIAFRRDIATPGPFTTSFSSVSIGLSTTSAAPDALSTTFLSNRGLDFTVVRSGALTLSSASSGGSPAPFDISIPLQTFFSYNPSQGNLLLEWQNFGGESFVFFLDATAVNGDAVSRSFAFDPNAVTGFHRRMDTIGLVTQFVPEPSTALLLAASLTALAASRRVA